MRIQQLEYAVAVARFGSFRRAAEALHLSQPALSENVRRLERSSGSRSSTGGAPGRPWASTGVSFSPTCSP